MSEFSKGVKKWWLRVVTYTDGYPRDQTLVYDEKHGFRQSVALAEEVHHLVPGSYAEIVLRERANDQVGLPVARRTHQGGGTTLPFCYSSTFHKDVEEARKRYRNGDKLAFKKLGEKHKRKAEKGKRYWGSDEGADSYYWETMIIKAIRYIAETGDKKPLSGKVLPKPESWTDYYFGIRVNSLDEET